MPSISWQEVRDFTGGLNSRGGFLVPSNAAQTMTDCVPQPQGGLRAFFGTTTISLSGIGAGEVAMATFVTTGVNATNPESADYWLLTWLASDKKMRLYRKDTSAGASTWSTLKTFTAGTTATPGHCNFALYTLSSGTTHLYVAHNNNGSSEAGVWRIALATGTLTQLTITGGFLRNLTVYQDRLLVATDEQNSSRIRYSDVASETFQVNGFQDVFPADGGNVWWFFPHSPSDMLIGKESAFVQLQGDITDPVVQRQSTAQNAGMEQAPIETEDGVVMQVPGDGYFVTPNGLTVTPLSPQLKDSDVTGPFSSHGSLGFPQYINGYLFTSFGKVWDRTTRAWFAISDWTTSTPVVAAYWRHRLFWRGFFVKNDLSGAVTIIPRESTTRKRTFTWKSAPFRSGSDRRIAIRRVQVTVNVLSSGGSCAVTVGGTTHTRSSLASGIQTLGFQFTKEAHELDVQVVVNSGSDSVEAPQLEVVRIGTQTGHRTTLNV